MTVTRLLIAFLPALAIAAGNYGVLRELPPVCASCVAWLVASPIALALLLVVMLPPPSVAAAQPAAADACPSPPPPPDAALRLLGLMQEEGRLVDFLEEDLASYPDDQIGAAVRGIHEGCRKALRERIAFSPILPGREGESVVVEPGFDPAAIRLTGNVTGTPPFRGVLRHAGWRAERATIPARPGQDPHVIAPAEVEIS
jgi:hypothetical protein